MFRAVEPHFSVDFELIAGCSHVPASASAPADRRVESQSRCLRAKVSRSLFTSTNRARPGQHQILSAASKMARGCLERHPLTLKLMDVQVEIHWFPLISIDFPGV